MLEDYEDGSSALNQIGVVQRSHFIHGLLSVFGLRCPNQKPILLWFLIIQNYGYFYEFL